MKVKIKTWKQMEREYGLDESSDIDCEFYFTEHMENLTPENRIIEVELINNIWRWLDYSISNDMISKYY